MEAQRILLALKVYLLVALVALLAASAALPPRARPVAASGLISYWRFDDGTGAVATDSIGANDGAIHGATWTAGKAGNALLFDGTDDYISLPNASSLQVEGTFTLLAWIRPDGVSQDAPVIMGNLGFAFSGGGYQLALNEGVERVNLEYRAAPAFDGLNHVAPVVNLNVGQWYHLAGVYEEEGGGATLTLYLDGNAVAQGTFSDPISYQNTPTFHIGTNINGRAVGGSWTREFPGAIDEVAVVGRAMTATEVQAQYERGLAGEGYLVEAVGGTATPTPTPTATRTPTPLPTSTATPPPALGGVGEFPALAGSSGRSAGAGVLAGIAAAVAASAVGLGGAAWRVWKA